MVEAQEVRNRESWYQQLSFKKFDSEEGRGCSFRERCAVMEKRFFFIGET